MPSVYLAKRNTGVPIPSFKQKDIASLMPGEPSALHVSIQGGETAQFPPTLMRHFAYTALKGVTRDVTNECFNLFKLIPTIDVLYEVPICSFKFEGLGTLGVNELKAMGLEQDLADKNLFVGSPPSSHLGRINALAPVQDRIRPGHTMFNGYLAWVYLMKGVQIYTSTRNGMWKDPLNVYVANGVGLRAQERGDIRSMDGSGVQDENPHLTDMIACFSGRFRIGAPKLPVTMKGEFVNGLVTSPDEKGYFFPYFHGLNIADKTIAYDVFASMFDGSLSDIELNGRKILATIRSGTRSLSGSRTGMALSHIYCVIGISLRMKEAKVKVVLVGSKYVGVTLVTESELHYNGDDLMPGSIQEEVKGINALEASAERIVAMANAVEVDGKGVYHFVKEDFMSSRRALVSFRSLAVEMFASTNNYGAIRDELKQMEFGDTFPVPTQDLVIKAIEYMATGNQDILTQFPAYLRGIVLHESGRELDAMTMFGERAPTMNNGSGDKGPSFTFPAPDKVDTNLVREGGVRPLHYLPFWVVPINVAVTQWRTMFATSRFSFPPGRKNKKEFTNMHRVVLSIGSEPFVSEVYTKLKMIANETRESGATGSKRKRTSDGDKKGKKAKLDVGDDF